MGAVKFISERIHIGSRVAVGAVATSFLIIIIAVAVSGGFRTVLRNGISSLSGDVVIEDVTDVQETSALVKSLDGVNSVSPVAGAIAVMRNGDKVKTVPFKGVEDVAPGTIVIPYTLADELDIGEGAMPYLFFVADPVRIRRFPVGGIYRPECEISRDALPVMASLSDMRKICPGSDTSCFENLQITLSPKWRENGRLEEKAFEISCVTGKNAIPSSRQYGSVFSWLDLVDANVLAILLLMSVVAGFNMISALLIILFRNIPTIGILKSMGMTDRKISGVFLLSASRMVLEGMVIGNVLAIAFCLVQKYTALIRLNPENYFVNSVPIELNVPMILISDIAAYAMIIVLLLLPLFFISGVDPARTVRVK